MIRLSANTVTVKSTSESTKTTALVLFASPRSNGFTKTLLDAFLNGLDSNYEIKIIDCYKLSPMPCDDCGLCKKADGCKFSDLDEYDRLLNSSELLVIATPVYNLSVPSPLKAAMDRSQRYFNKRFSLGIKPPIKKHKEAVLLMTCGSDDTAGFEIIQKQFERMFTVINTTLCAVVTAHSTDKRTNITDEVDKAYLLGQAISKK